MTTWNFGGFEQDVESSMDSLGIFNNLSLKRKGNCSVDLKLGRIDEPIDGLLDTWSVPQGLKKASDSRLIRRTRKTGGANTSPYCLVEGCQSDFSNSREYHKRHKVCEIHAKTPVVIVAGQQQRFCQQCSRQILKFILRLSFGLMNIVGSFSSCYVTTGIFSKFTVNYNAGSMTPTSNIIMAIMMMMVLLFLAPLFRYTPLMCISSVITAAMLPLIKYKQIYRFYVVDKGDFLICMAAFISVAFVSMDMGLLVYVSLCR